MENSDIINLWKSYDKKLEETVLLNKNMALEVTQLKTESLLKSMRPVKAFTLLTGIIWVISGSVIIGNLFVHAYDRISHIFLYSSAIQLIITTIAIVIYIYQLVLIQQVDIGMDIIQTQSNLSKLRSSTLWSARILFLQFPVWTTFYLSKNTILSGDIAYILINGIITLIFTYLAIWLFINIKYENRDQTWFQLIFTGNEWNPIIRSMELYEDIKEYQNEGQKG